MANAVPPFDVLNQNYPNFVSVETVKRLIGGALNDLDAPPDQQWLGGANGNTCTIRLSRMLNYSGVPIPKNPPGLAHGRAPTIATTRLPCWRCAAG